MTDRHVSGDRLSAFLDDELAESEAAAATRHLISCDRCLAELQSLRATREALRSLPLLQAPVLTAGVERRSGGLRKPSRAVRILAVAAVIPMFLIAVVYLAGEDLGNVEPSTELFLIEHVARTGGGPVPAPMGGAPR